MMNDGKYESPFQPTVGKILASLWVLLWIGIANHEFGAVLAIRIGLFFGFLLMLIWIPEILSKWPLPIHQRDAGALGPVPAKLLRWVSWVILLGLPATWLLFGHGSG